MRWAMPHPCMGSSARVFKIRRSNVPWTKSVGLLIHPPQLSTVQYMLAPPLVNSQGGRFVKGRFSDLKEIPIVRTHDGNTPHPARCRKEPGSGGFRVARHYGLMGSHGCDGICEVPNWAPLEADGPELCCEFMWI